MLQKVKGDIHIKHMIYKHKGDSCKQVLVNHFPLPGKDEGKKFSPNSINNKLTPFTITS